PRSAATSKIRRAVASSLWPAKVIVPRQTSETFKPVRPSRRYFMVRPPTELRSPDDTHARTRHHPRRPPAGLEAPAAGRPPRPGGPTRLGPGLDGRRRRPPRGLPGLPGGLHGRRPRRVGLAGPLGGRGGGRADGLAARRGARMVPRVPGRRPGPPGLGHV